MIKKLLSSFILAYLGIASSYAGTAAISKDTTTLDIVNGSFNVPSGVTQTFESGATFNALTGSTIDLHLATVSLPSTGSNYGLPRLGLDANGTALKASTGAYNGQLGMARDGYLGRWNGSAWVSSFVFGGPIYAGSDGTSTGIVETVATPDGSPVNYFQYTRIEATGAHYIDNALVVLNHSTNPGGTAAGYAATTYGTQIASPALPDGAVFTMGFPGIWGLSGGSTDYATGGYIATNPKQSTTMDTAVPFGLFQEKTDTIGGFNQHRRIYFTGGAAGALKIYAYGITEGSGTGPISWYVDPSGIMCVGGDTVSGTAALQVTGVIRESGVTSSFVGADSAGKHIPTTTTLGDLPYAGASAVPSRLAGNTTTTPQLLTQTGTGAVSAAPAWANPSAVQGLPRLGVDANGTVLQASTGAYTGQLGIARDGGIAFWNGTNWNQTLTFIKQAYFADSAQVFNGLSIATGNISFVASGIGILGTITNDSANAGNVGQFVSSLVASGSAVSLTSPTPANVTSISLTAGDWDVAGNVNYIQTTATVTSKQSSIGTASATLATDGSEVYSGSLITIATATDGITLPRKRISIAGTTTLYLVGQATFSAGTVTAFGSINARRVR